MLQTVGLGRSFGSRVALREVGLTARTGEILALLGPNGAGKTTLLKLIATLLRPTKGRVFLDGVDLASRRARVQARRRIGLLSHQPMLYDHLTAEENLSFFAGMYGVPSARERSRQLLFEVGLEGRGDDLVRDYSRGLQQRLAIARALVHDPDLLLLDEPFSGLDPQGAGFLSSLLRALASRGKTILFTTHDLHAGESLCHRAAFLARGALVLELPRERFGDGGLAAVYEEAVAPGRKRGAAG